MASLKTIWCCTERNYMDMGVDGDMKRITFVLYCRGWHPTLP